MNGFWFKFVILLNLCQRLHSFNFFGTGGSWCPYQVDKFVSCQVRNGTETYFGSPICWKALNGSFSCTKRLLRRPKFVTTYKKVKETRYKCCPAYFGSDCHLECFNCTIFEALQTRVQQLESKLVGHPKETVPSRNLNPELDFDNDNAIDVEELNDDHEHLEIAISTLVSNVRDLDVRLRAVEHKLSRMMSTIQDVSMTNIGLKAIIDSLTDPTLKSGPTSAAANYYKLAFNTSADAAAGDQYPSFRILEHNLARGDIASTLNDDYGEQNSSVVVAPEDEYVDPFHLDEDDDGDDDDE